MIIVKAVKDTESGAITPEEPLQNFPTVIRWEFDGTEYKGHEEGTSPGETS